MSKRNKFLKQLTAAEIYVCHLVFLRLLECEFKEIVTAGGGMIIGFTVEQMVAGGAEHDMERMTASCESLVEKGVFRRHQGEDESLDGNAPLDDDNWYGFNPDFITAINDTNGVWLMFAEMFHAFRQDDNFQKQVLAVAVRATLQATYL